ncbi:DNA-binding transcriptional regulator, MarR family [Rhodococcoides kyotonense]|uniref:DNA-binding transcriptional regulator, MarR family n=2 Tax=Rhodococcoides kyotonense TaxID=398843 RepID=A0A239J9L9_9NOCA|nr:DNA-binding transcriptional regulator, MarR family [Rhodococcus kyotonensis]
MAMRLNRQLRLRHASDRLPVAHLSILTTLFREGPTTTGELAVRERIKPPSISRSSHTLVEMGLIERVPHPTDGRQVLLTLTDEGRRVAMEDVAAREQVLAAQVAKLTDDQRVTLARSVDILTEIVERAD